MGLASQIRQNIMYRGIFLLFQLVNTILISRLAGPSGFGQYALLTVNANFLLTVTSLGLPAGILFHASSGNAQPGGLLKLSWISTGVQALVILVVEWLFFQYNKHFFVYDDPGFLQGMTGLLFTLTIILTEKYYALYNGYGYLLNYHRVMAFINIGLAVVLFFWPLSTTPATQYVIYIFVGFQLLQLLILVIGFSRKPILPNGSKKLPSAAFFTYSFAAFLANLLYFLMTRIDVWMVEYFHGKETLGWYALPMRLLQMILILPGLLSSILLPAIATKDLDEQVFARVLRLLNTFNLLILAGAALLSPWALPFFFGAQFSPGVPVLLLLIPGAFFLSAQIFLSAWFAGKGMVKINLFSMLWGTFLAIVMYRLLIPGYGIKGAATASSVSYGLSFLISYLYFCKHSGFSWKQLFVHRGDLEWSKQFIKAQRSKW